MHFGHSEMHSEWTAGVSIFPTKQLLSVHIHTHNTHTLHDPSLADDTESPQPPVSLQLLRSFLLINNGLCVTWTRRKSTRGQQLDTWPLVDWLWPEEATFPHWQSCVGRTRFHQISKSVNCSSIFLHICRISQNFPLLYYLILWIIKFGMRLGSSPNFVMWQTDEIILVQV